MTRPLVAFYWVKSNGRDPHNHHQPTPEDIPPPAIIVEDNHQPQSQNEPLSFWYLLKNKLALRAQ